MKRSSTAERLRYLMDLNGWKQVDILNKCLPVAEKYGVKLRKNDIHYYLSGESVPGQDKLSVLGLGLNVSEAWLMGFDVPMERGTVEQFKRVSTQRVPLLGEIACGEPIIAEESFECYVEAGTNIKCDFCLRARGDSMINARIFDGDIVFIRQQSIVNNGEIAAVIIENEATLKRVYLNRAEGKLVLQAENPSYEPLVYVGEELDHIRILGKAVAFQSDVK